MQTQAAQTQVHTIARRVSGGEFAMKVTPSGRVAYYWCGHKVSQREAQRLQALKRA